MTTTLPETVPNPDLAVGPDRRPRWNSAPDRRQGFHNLHRVARYVQSFRAARVLPLRLSADLAIASRPDVAALTSLPWFSAMVVARGQRVLFERYAPDFGPDRPHPLMSISKMTMNLEIGRLWAAGRIGLDERAAEVLPWVGPGYAAARVQDVLNMNVLNDYDEDYSNPLSAVFQHEAATGLRLPPGAEEGTREVLARIGLAPGAADCVNRTGISMYRSANTDLLGAMAEARGGRSLTAVMADLTDAAGMEGQLHCITDRAGFAYVDGGICLTARDLARLGLLIARRGAGVNGAQVGAPAFFDLTLQGGVAMPVPRTHLRYSNQTNTNGRWLGHGGYGGQYMLVDMQSGTVAVFMSVLQDEAGYDTAYYLPIIAMLEALACD